MENNDGNDKSTFKLNFYREYILQYWIWVFTINLFIAVYFWLNFFKNLNNLKETNIFFFFFYFQVRLTTLSVLIMTSKWMVIIFNIN